MFVVLGKIADIKVYTIICAVLPLVFAAVFFFQPETPVYRLKKGNDAAARQELLRLRGSHYNVDAELNDMKKALEEEERNKVSLSTSLKKSATRRAALISFGLMFFQQASGINAVIFYTADIFEASGVDMDPQLATIIVGIMQVSRIYTRLGRLLCVEH